MRKWFNQYVSIMQFLLIIMVAILLCAVPVFAFEEGVCDFCGMAENYQVELLQIPEDHLPGKRVYTCLSCGHQKEEELPATGHVYNEWKEEIAATTTREGLRYRICTKCNDPKTKEVAVIPKLEAPLEEVEPEEEILEEGILTEEPSEPKSIEKEIIEDIPKKPWGVTDTVLVGTSGISFLVFAILILGDIQVLLWYRRMKREARNRIRRGVV